MKGIGLMIGGGTMTRRRNNRGSRALAVRGTQRDARLREGLSSESSWFGYFREQSNNSDAARAALILGQTEGDVLLVDCGMHRQLIDLNMDAYLGNDLERYVPTDLKIRMARSRNNRIAVGNRIISASQVRARISDTSIEAERNMLEACIVANAALGAMDVPEGRYDVCVDVDTEYEDGCEVEPQDEWMRREIKTLKAKNKRLERTISSLKDAVMEMRVDASRSSALVDTLRHGLKRRSRVVKKRDTDFVIKKVRRKPKT